MKGSNNGDLKVFMVRHYSCCKYVKNQSKFVETGLNLQRNWFYYGYLWKKWQSLWRKTVSIENIITHLWILDSDG